MKKFKNDAEFAKAVENYEVAESLSKIRWSNNLASDMYDRAFDKSTRSMKFLAEEYEVEYAEVLKAVREVASI